MNVKSLLLLLTFAGFGASCNNDDANGPDAPGGRTEIQIAFSGAGESQEYTKATASESENEIKTLQIHLFAAAAKDGPYYYLETWNEGNAFVPPAAGQAAVTNFKKTETGTGWKASLYPNEVNGLPFVKLMCIANNGEPVGGTTDGKFYAEDGTTPTVATLVPVTVGGDGKADVTGATTEAAFRATFTQNLGADAATGIIVTPLVMTGTGETKIAGSVSKVDITLRRIVARFDIENNATKSNLTIEEVSLAQGRANGIFWGAARADVTQDNLITYQPIAFDKIPGANSGVTESAVYTYPNLPTDESFLILKGFYKSPISSELVPVTYNVPIVRTAEGATKGEYIPVMANSRYRLRITDVTQNNVFGTFEVVDWVSGGGIVVKPDNDAPVFAGVAAFTSATGNLPLKLANGTAPGDTCNYEVTGDVDGKGSFTVEIAATGAVRAEKGMVTKAGETDWLSISSATSTERDGVWYSKFDITYEESIGLQPVAVTFINETASYDPALWTTVNFYGPKALPGFAATTNPIISTGNKIDFTVQTAPVATLYKMNGSQVQLDVTCVEGVEIGEVPEGIEVIPPTGISKTYTIKVKDAATAVAGDIEFKNAGDGNKISTVALNLNETGMTVALNTTSAASLAGNAQDGYVITVDLETLANGNFSFKVNSPEGLGIPAPVLNSGWLNITGGLDWTVDNTFNTYTVAAKSSSTYPDCVLNFANVLEGAPAVKVTLKKGHSKVKMSVTGSEINGKNEAIVISNDQTATGTMYATGEASNQLQLKVTCLDGVSTTATCTNGLSATNAGDVWTIKTDGVAMSGTGTVTFASDKSGSLETAVLTVTYKDPAIKAEITGDGAGAVEIAGNIIYVDPAKFVGGSFSVKLTGAKDSEVSLKTTTATWANVMATGTIPVSGSKSCMVGATDENTDTSDYVINVHNVITGQDEIFTLKYMVKP